MARRKYVVPFTAGCGTRRVGQAYMYTNYDKLAEKGYPLSYFLFDPPILVEDPKSWGLCAQGISYIQQNGVWHAQDWVGVGFYPNVADILEEIVSHNASGLIPLTEGINKLGPGSRRLLFHPHGWLYNPRPYKETRVSISGRDECPIPEDQPAHAQHLEVDDMMCAGLHWQTVENGVQQLGRLVKRTVGSTEYFGAMPLQDPKPEYGLALVCWLPIDEIHLVEGDGTEAKDQVAKALDLLERVSQLPVFLTNA